MTPCGGKNVYETSSFKHTDRETLQYHVKRDSIKKIFLTERRSYYNKVCGKHLCNRIGLYVHYCKLICKPYPKGKITAATRIYNMIKNKGYTTKRYDRRCTEEVYERCFESCVNRGYRRSSRRKYPDRRSVRNGSPNLRCKVEHRCRATDYRRKTEVDTT